MHTPLRRLTITAVLMTTLSAAAGSAEQKSSAASAADISAATLLLGNWKSSDDSESVVRFEPDKVLLGRLGKPGIQIWRVTYAPGRIIARSWGINAEFRFELQDRALSLTPPNGAARTYVRMPETPTELDVQPMRLGQEGGVPPAKVRSIQEDLATRGKRDQEVRTQPPRPDEMMRVDADNTSFLIRLVQEIGWIDVKRFGKEAAENAFLIVQHSMDMPLMLAALPRIEADVKSGQLDGILYALLYDRVQVSLANKQRYGTQIATNEKGEMVVLSLEDRARVEELRKDVGLPSLAESLRINQQQNGGNPIKFEDDQAHSESRN